MSGENCTEGGKSGWHNKGTHPQTEPLLLQNNVSMAKQLPTALSSLAKKKLRNSRLTPQYRAEQFPNNLYVSANTHSIGSIKISAMTMCESRKST